MLKIRRGIEGFLRLPAVQICYFPQHNVTSSKLHTSFVYEIFDFTVIHYQLDPKFSNHELELKPPLKANELPPNTILYRDSGWY